MTDVIQVVGYKNSGKTTLVEHLVRTLTAAGLAVGTVKHDAHRFDVDREGTDTFRHREAGACMTAITSDCRTAFMEERPVPLEEIVRRMTDMDAVVVEGFKQDNYAKIVMLRTQEDEELLHRLTNVRAVVSWFPGAGGGGELPVFPLADADGLAKWVQANLLAQKP
ncbi:molybdopterin-guanine dinucleotide biosynthesis protein B [Cohnella fermenti]|uniref:Molybdopterin-guanine dinucleotide biosynthesis protein B n=1 Tax=Cohnella fermenti TaxID=2565925 RepID=A0A4S4BMP5_9BACL|nr:molybdopterin-guanine dinucleotide biosynthesis protein B [Cohnella fermenti]